MASISPPSLLTALYPSPLPLLHHVLSPSPSRHYASRSSNLDFNPSFHSTYKSVSVITPRPLRKNLGYNRSLTVRSSLNLPLISPQDHWGIWTALFCTGAFGLWSEKTKIGSMISAALVSILVGLAASNLGVIPFEAPAYKAVFEYLLPLTIPLLLFRADMRNVIQSTGTLLLAFFLGSVATVVGTAVAFFLVPMRSLGQDSWKIAAALMSSYIGGAINYVAVGGALGVSPSVLAAGVAADNVISAIYFVVLFTLASQIPAESSTSSEDAAVIESDSGNKLHILQTATAVAMSMVICKASTYISQLLGIQGGSLPIITASVVVLATLLPKQFAYIVPAGDAIAIVLMQVFFAVVGASGSIWNVINTAPSIFVFAFIQVTVHLLVILGFGKLFRLDLKSLLIASNANVGGPTTACGMATAKGWSSLIVPGILVGIFGISVATFFGIGIGILVLKRM